MLKPIQDTVIRYAQILTHILKVDIGIVDNNLRYIAITGHTSHLINQDISEQAYVFKQALKSGEPQIIYHPRHHSLCQECPSRSVCNETFEMNVPIMLNNTAIGVIGLMCFTEEQRQHILNNYDHFFLFLKEISDLIALKAMEARDLERSLTVLNLMENIIDRVETGIIVFDNINKISRINQIGKKILRLSEKELKKSLVSIKETGEKLSDMIEYDIQIGENRYRLFGKQYDICIEHYSKILFFNDVNFISIPSMSNINSKNNTGIKRLLGPSAQIEEIRRKILMTSSSSSTVLLIGEDGTEKKQYATAIYEESNRINEPFITFNCAEVPPDQIEEELFGSISATGIQGKIIHKTGKIEAAKKGVIFIDEITRMPLSLQYRLLNVLISKKITKNGLKKSIPVHARFIFACTDEIDVMLKNGEFRKDLYYRMNVIPIDIPPLRDRKSDITILAQSLISQNSKVLGKTVSEIDPEFWRILKEYSWPGNMWELQNTMEYVVNILPYSGNIESNALPNRIRMQNFKEDDNDVNLKNVEKATIVKAIELYGTDKNILAEKLGVGVATVYRKLEQYGLK